MILHLLPLQQLHTQGFTIKQQGKRVLVVGTKRARWAPDNLIYRSSMWEMSDDTPWQQVDTVAVVPVSLGFKKFFNWGEKPCLYTLPKHVSRCKAFEKVDGTCLIVSRYNGELIIRTRGSFGVKHLPNYDEIAQLRKKYPLVFLETLRSLDNTSLVFEWKSAQNPIVIQYQDCPKLSLLSVVNHDYTYYSQAYCDHLATALEVDRPWSMQLPATFARLQRNIAQGENYEGVVVYYGKDQQLLKLKTLWYLQRHLAKFHLKFDTVLQMYLDSNCVNIEQFADEITCQYDVDIPQQWFKCIDKAMVQFYIQIIKLYYDFENVIYTMPTRKTQAVYIKTKYKGYWQSLAFAVLNKKAEMYRKLKFALVKQYANEQRNKEQ